jgi:hypothetical protein
MDGKCWRVCGLAVLCALMVLCVSQAQDDVKATDEGKAEDFKGKTFDLKEKGKAAIYLTFPAEQEATITVKSTGKPDVNLFVYQGKKDKEIAKDDSPGPDCSIALKGGKKDRKLKLVVVNLGPGETKSTLKVKVGK